MIFSYAGHEFPFAIQMNQHREMSILDDSDFIAPVPDPPAPPPAVEVTPENQLQFILKKGRKMHNKGRICKMCGLHSSQTQINS